MKLFKDITIKEKLVGFEIPDFEQKLEIIKTWADDYHQGSLKTDKETSRAGGYNQAVFSDILGYIRKPSPQATFDAEYSLQGKFPDGVLGYFHTDNEKEDNICAVIELKGANIPLDQPQKREKNYTPIEQGFGYKRLLRNCPFVIVSNFYELRLYNDNEIDYEVWTLDDLLDPTDAYFNFKKFYYLLCAEHLIAETGSSKTESLMSDIRLEEQDITKKFYADYKARRHLLLQNLYLNNAELRDDPDLLIEMGQKLIDRVIFMCFAEDRGLLPADILQTIKRDFEKSSMVASVWDSLKIAFNYVNKGNEHWGIPDGYNGGLFARDDRFDDLKVDGHILSKIIDFGMYDFADQLSVTILGHIFEQSISDLEEIKEKIEDFGKENTEQKETKTSKRKKDGIFYTPEYIVDYIVKNSLGTHLREHETKLIEQENLHDGLSEREYQKREKIVYTKYQEFLSQVKVLDPACGSGAFLVRVFDYLLEENRRVGKILGGLFNTDEIYKDILQNNIYGVDLNTESVEITKLSLWLKSAQKGKKLSNLDNNIKCGNSLIDDPAVAGDKSFKWEEEFKDILDNGGFDVVVGNPPYVRKQGLVDAYPEMCEFYEEKYQSATANYDIYALFMERSFGLINSQGIVSYILPHKFLVTDFGVGIRKFFIENKAVKSIVHFGSEMVFQEASTYTCIISLNKSKKDKVLFKKTNPLEIQYISEWDYMLYKNLDEHNWDLQSQRVFDVINKLKQQTYTIDIVFDRIFQGIASGGDKFFTLELIKNKGQVGVFYSEMLNENIEIEFGVLKPFVKGNQISKYHNIENTLYTLFPYSIVENKAIALSFKQIEKEFPLAATYFRKNEEFLRRREKGRFNNEEEWFLFSRKQGITGVEFPKIMTQEISLGCNMTYDEKGEFYHPTTIYSFVKKSKFKVDDKFYLGILNSQIMWFFLKNTGTELRGGYFRFKTNYLKPFPLPEIPENPDFMVNNVNTILNLNKQFEEQSSRFLQRMVDNYDLEKANKKLEKFWELEFGDFIKEMRKKGAEVKLSEQDELQDYFEQNKSELLDLDAQIKSTDAEIDKMVYELYGLNDEEIKIIENN